HGKALTQARGERNGRRDHVALPIGKGLEQHIESAHLHGAGQGEPLAGGAGELHGKACRATVQTGEVKGWKIVIDQKTDGSAARQIRALQLPTRIPEVWDENALGLSPALSRTEDHGEENGMKLPVARLDLAHNARE